MSTEVSTTPKSIEKIQIYVEVVCIAVSGYCAGQRPSNYLSRKVDRSCLHCEHTKTTYFVKMAVTVSSSSISIVALAISTVALLPFLLSLTRNDLDGRSVAFKAVKKRLILRHLFDSTPKVDQIKEDDINGTTIFSLKDREQASILLSQSIVSADESRKDMDDLLRFQLWMYRSQHPSDCRQYTQHHFRGWHAGFGSALQVVVNSFISL